MTLVLEVDRLCVRLPTPDGSPQWSTGSTTASRPVRCSASPARAAGRRCPCSRSWGCCRRARRSKAAVFEGQDLLRLPPGQLRRICGRDLAMVFQDPMTSLHPMLSIGTQLTEHVRLHLGLGRRAAAELAVEALREVRIPDPESALRLPAPVLRRDATTDRHRRARVPAEAPRRRRADDRARRHGPGRDHPTARPPSRESGLTIVLITHDLGVLSSIADRVAVFYAGRVVEAGSRTEVLGHPRHPYTRLLDALPHPEAAATPLIAIHGAPPTPRRIPPGCAFHPRCRYARASCSEAIPPLVPVNGRALACPVDRAPGRSVERPRAHQRRRGVRAPRTGAGARGRRREPRDRTRRDRRTRRRVGLRQVDPRPRGRRDGGTTVGDGSLRGPGGQADSRRPSSRSCTCKWSSRTRSPRSTRGDESESRSATRSPYWVSLRERSGRPKSRSSSCRSGFEAAARGYPTSSRAASASASPSPVRSRRTRPSSSSTSLWRRSTPRRRRRSRISWWLARVRPRPSPHLARSRDRPPRGRHRRGHVPGADRRERPDPRTVGDASAPVQRGAHQRRPPRRRLRNDAGSAAGRGARSVATASGMLPPALPVRLRSLPVGGACPRRLAPARSAACWLQQPGAPLEAPSIQSAARLASAPSAG